MTDDTNTADDTNVVEHTDDPTPGRAHEAIEQAMTLLERLKENADTAGFILFMTDDDRRDAVGGEMRGTMAASNRLCAAIVGTLLDTMATGYARKGEVREETLVLEAQRMIRRATGISTSNTRNPLAALMAGGAGSPEEIREKLAGALARALGVPLDMVDVGGPFPLPNDAPEAGETAAQADADEQPHTPTVNDEPAGTA